MNVVTANGIVAAVICAASIGTYHRFVIAPSRTIGVVDAGAVFRAKEAQFVKQMTDSRSEDERQKTMQLAREFTHAFPGALEQLEKECDCMVIDRSAVLGTRPNMVDLTPILKEKVKL